MALSRNMQDPVPFFAGSSTRRHDVDAMDTEHDFTSSDPNTRVGLLSHTLIQSPIIQWILPARLRGKHQNDVIFVGERSLQIKEAVSGVHLKEVTSKSDFDTQIMAAKVINVGTELPDVPPQILCLSLASKELVFLFYSNKSAQFIHYRRPLPNDVSTFERFGRNIAVEPRSRAVAVSAACDYFGVFILKSPPVLQSQMAEDQLTPIAEERFFRVDGDIIFMDFLYPKPEESNKIILLLLVAQNQITHAICYEWDAQSPIKQASPRVIRRLLPFEDRLPTILIPLTKASSFMLITTTTMTVYKNKLDPRQQPRRYPLHLHVPDRESHRSPLWTRWARPLRNAVYNQKHDDIYLCREDGQVFYLGIGNGGEVENQAHLGQLCCDVDAAFDILDIENEGGDLLLAAGTSGDGGLFVQKAREQPICVQKFMNWTPVTDSVLVTSASQDSPSEEVSSDRLFVCSASPFSRGAIVELRYGIVAQIGLVIPVDELSATRDIWAMADEANGGIFVLTSSPISSLLLYLSGEFGEEICAVDEEDSGLDYSAQTLAAGRTDSGLLIQVTANAIRLGATPDGFSGFCFEYEPSQSITAAAVNETPSLVIVAVRAQHHVHLHFKRAVPFDNDLRLYDICSPLEFHHEPTCISIEVLDSGLFVFVGTGNGRIVMYNVEEKVVTLLLDVCVDLENGRDISRAIDSITVVSMGGSKEALKSYAVLCGLRSGILVCFELICSQEGTNPASLLELKQASSHLLGRTSVKVQGRGDLAHLTCGQGFWQASCLQNGGQVHCTLQRIWITDQNNPAYHPKTVDSFSITTVVNSDMDGLAETLFFTSDGQLLICNLDRGAKTIPRRINLPGSATKLAYSQHLKSLIVAYTKTAFDTDTDPIKRFSRSYIEFVDPELQHTVSSPPEVSAEEESRPWRPHGAAGEKISCILEWTPKKGDEQYHFIVIGTTRRHQQERGRVIFLQASRDPSNPSRIECATKYVHKFESPVYSIAPYGDFTLMVSTGHDIVPLEPRLGQTRGFRAARYPVLSPAVSMTVHEPYLYMSMSRESLMVLKASGEDKLVLHAYDRQKHDGLAHIHLGGNRNLTLTSSRGGRVSILTEVGVTDQDKMMPVALAEAHLPSSVIRLTTGSRQSPISPGAPLIYGTTMNGTIYQFSVIGEKEWRLLHLLQNLCARDPVICPFTPKRKRQRNPVGSELLDFQPSRMHIDGDILHRLLVVGSDHLMHMLVTDEFYNQSSPETASPAAIWERFSEVSRDVLGEEVVHPVDGVMAWLRRSLHVHVE
ncbi:hypothetical protein FE257_012386 [Aspergillus nanangensis]|uniref:Cleavage/polyadenylation specificity factor A subunit N-terminal domain-containing protein n=1 Tax=Aspergillus nanangensis TaxID=2582783 RepID=A0AAD4CG09_ASPNN|nr:hypothetical protein FE257_012386 [Aspergillus nanangensis]